MHSEHTSSPPYPAHSANRLFGGLFLGAYALLLVDLAAAGQLAQDWATPLLGAIIVLLGTLAFPAVERRKSRWLTGAYFAVQLPLGVAIFGNSVLGSTFLLLVIVGQIATKVVAELTRLAGSPQAPIQLQPYPLSEREVEIVRLLARGATNREIAAALILAEGTVKNHLKESA